MSWSKKQYPILPKVGTALAGLGALLVLVPLTLVTPEVAGAATASLSSVNDHAAANLTGPITVGHIIEPLSAQPLDLAVNGYVEQEFFASGTAAAFKADSMPSDGKWTITPTTTASYKTRIIVRRPSNPARFNGTVIVEWMNVSAGESAPDWDFLNPMLMRDGYAYVGVSAQKLGVDGGTALLGSPGSSAPNGGLVGSEPARYGSLHHPGDQSALDMYAQIGQALRTPHQKALGGLKPKHILAVGESQSAFYLTTYADTLQPLTNVYDGIFIHQSRRFGCLLGRNLHHKEQRARQPAHPHRSEGPRLHVPNPDRPDSARLRPRAAAQHRQDPYLGDRRHRTRRRLHRGRCREPPRLHHAREQRPPAQRGPGCLHRLRQVGRQRHAAPEPATLHVVELRIRRPWPSMRMATSSGECGHRPSTSRSPPSAAHRPRGRTPSAPSSGPPSRSPRPSSPASTAPRATTSRCTRRASTRPSRRGTSSAPTRLHSWRRPSRCSSLPDRCGAYEDAAGGRGQLARFGGASPRWWASQAWLSLRTANLVSSPSSPVSHPHEHSPTTPTRPTKLVTWDATCTNRCSSGICRPADVAPPLARGHVWDLRFQPPGSRRGPGSGRPSAMLQS